MRRCLEVVHRERAQLMVGFNRRFDPNFASLRGRILNGDVGEVEIIQITSRDPGPPPVAYIPRSGGLFRDMMIHDLDMARFLLDEEPVEVMAMASNLVDPEIGSLGDVDSATVMLRTASGKLCQISNSRRASYGYDQRVEVHGSSGMVRAENMRATTVEVAGKEGYRRDPLLGFFMDRYAAAYAAEIAAFIGALEAGHVPTPSGEDGLRALLLAEAAARSVETGRVCQAAQL